MPMLNFLSAFLLGSVTTALFITDEGRKLTKHVTTMVRDDLEKARATTEEKKASTEPCGKTDGTDKGTGGHHAQY